MRALFSFFSLRALRACNPTRPRITSTWRSLWSRIACRPHWPWITLRAGGALIALLPGRPLGSLHSCVLARWTLWSRRP